MNAEECNARATECAANAALATADAVSLEFLRLAAQWRAMAVSDIHLGRVERLVRTVALPAPPGAPSLA